MTRGEIFEKLLPPEIAQEAKENTKTKTALSREVGYPKMALITAFAWEHTKQGQDYWQKVDEEYFSCRNLEQLKTGNGATEHK
jgi:hypothetical protein